MMRSSWSTWPVSSFWIASEVFFLGRRRGFSHGPEFADLRVDLNELLTELPIVAKLRHLTLRFGERRRTRKGLGDSFAINLVSEPIRRSMRGLVGKVAAAVRLATAARSGGDGAGAKIAQTSQLMHDSGTLLL
jgi:hypothetical protein